MSSTLYRLGRAMAAARWKVVAAWALLLVLIGALAIGLGGKFSSAFEIPGTEAQQWQDELAERFPEMGGGTGGSIVFVTTDGSTVDDHKTEIQDAMKEIGKVDKVDTAQDPFNEQAEGTRNDDDTAIIASVQTTSAMGDVPPATVDKIEDIAADASTDGMEVHVGGQILNSVSVPFGIGEVLGVILALVILSIVFKSVIPAFIPIVTAIVGVGVAMLAVMALSAGVDMPSVTTALGAMLGLAVGIDYALFILSRHRDQLKEGMDVKESIGEAIATSGSSVIFAGLTVVIALVGLFVAGIPFLTTMGVAAAGTVAIAVCVALTLLPAIAGILGEHLRPGRIRKLMAANGGAMPADEDGNGKKRPFGTSWVRIVTKVPALTIVLVIAVVVVLALPARDMRLALPDQGTDEPGTASRDTYDLIADQFGPGYNGQILVTADIINSTDPLGDVDDLKTRVEALPDVKEVQLATPNRGADLAVIVAIPDSGPNDQATTDLVNKIRADAPSWEDDLDISDVTVTGQAAVGIDITDKLSKALLPFGIFVVGLSLILLMVVFRSIWVPVKAAVGYLFSVLAAFGVTTMVFEYGWGNSLLNVHVNGPVVAFMPIFVMGVLFGLAMDYEVFLVSRMREEYVHTRQAHWAIERGFTASAPVVIAAALIMASVFGGFVTSGWFMLQPIAVALAVGVLVDAFLVRMTLVPAVLALLGNHAWWLPRWLDHLLPRVDIEGEGLKAALEHRAWTEEHGETAIRLDGTVVWLVGAEGRLGLLTAAVKPGTLLVARSTDDAARQTFLELASGRLEPTDGIFAMHDRLAPDDLGAMQSRVYRVGRDDDLVATLRVLRSDKKAGQRILVVDDVADLAHATTVTEGAAMHVLEGLMAEGLTVVTSSRSNASAPATQTEHHVVEALADPSRYVSLPLQRTALTSPELVGA